MTDLLGQEVGKRKKIEKWSKNIFILLYTRSLLCLVRDDQEHDDLRGGHGGGGEQIRGGGGRTGEGGDKWVHLETRKVELAPNQTQQGCQEI